MIQTAATAATGAPAAPTGNPAGQGAAKGEKGGFAQLLSIQPGTDGASAEPLVTPQPDPSAGSAPAAEIVDLPKLAGPLPLAGKILPGSLPPLTIPLATTGQDAPDEAVAEPVHTDVTHGIPGLLAAMRAAGLAGTAAPAVKTAPGQARKDPASAPADGAAQDDDSQAAPVAPGVSAILKAADPLPATAAEAPAASASPKFDAQLPSPALAQTLANTAAPTPAPAQAQPVTPERVLEILPAPSAAAAAAAAATPILADAPSVRPAPGIRLRPVFPNESNSATSAKPGAPAHSEAAETPAAALSLLSGSAAPAAPAAAAPATSAQPHDFTALMDRLMAARDAAQSGMPQNVHVAVNHAEFGKVSLHFQQDQSGLAVSVSSADPDFARAVQAAVPAPSAGAGMSGSSRDNSQGGGNQANTRGDANTASSGTFGGDAGQRSARDNTDPRQPHRGPAANPSNPRSEAAARRRGLFA